MRSIQVDFLNFRIDLKLNNKIFISSVICAERFGKRSFYSFIIIIIIIYVIIVIFGNYI